MDDIMALKRTAAGNADTKMKRKAYEKELRKLQVELCRVQDWIKAKGARIIIVAVKREAEEEWPPAAGGSVGVASWLRHTYVNGNASFCAGWTTWSGCSTSQSIATRLTRPGRKATAFGNMPAR
jgi:hypothetical protein